MRKVIQWELCKRWKFDHTNKWYIYEPESILENETNKILWYFKIQTDHLIPARKLDLLIEPPPPTTTTTKQLWNVTVTVIPFVISALVTILKGLERELEELEIGRGVETTKTTALSSSAKIMWSVLEKEETCCGANKNVNPAYYFCVWE